MFLILAILFFVIGAWFYSSEFSLFIRLFALGALGLSFTFGMFFSNRAVGNWPQCIRVDYKITEITVTESSFFVVFEDQQLLLSRDTQVRIIDSTDDRFITLNECETGWNLLYFQGEPKNKNPHLNLRASDIGD